MGRTGFRSNLEAWRQGLATQDEVETALVQEVSADPQLHAVVLSLIEAYRHAGHIPVPFAQRLLVKVSQPARVVAGPVARGRILANQYAIEGLVCGGDRGGNGLVFKARDLILEEALDRNPFVAIKVFNEKFTRDPQSMAALHREYKNALKLSHPNIVKLQNFNRDGADVFIVMELLQGRTLADVIAAVKTEKPARVEAMRIVDSLMQALAYAHQCGVVHSDFKPRNAFITDDGTVKVMDFGVGTAIKSSGEHIGISCYASCEQIEGASPDPRDDVYALAVVTYEILTGVHPFDRKDAESARRLGLRPPSISGLSRRQWHIVHAGLSFTRDDRPADAAAFGAGFRPKSWPVKLLLASAAALALAVVAISVLVSGWMERRDAEQIARDLDSPIPAVLDEAVSRLFQTDEATRDAVLSKEGTKKKVLTVYERQARSAFDPGRGANDYARAAAIMGHAKIVLPDYEPLDAYAEALSREAKSVARREQ